MDLTTIERRIAEILIQELRLENASADSFDVDLNLVEELGLDSMDFITVVLVVQNEFKIKIDEEEYPNLKTVRLIAQHIRQLQEAA
jgi:acyl carrier protein